MSENAVKPVAKKSKFKSNGASTLTIVLIFVAMVAILSIVKPVFLDKTNLLNTARAFSAYAIAGLGVSMVIMTGGIDISVGSIYGLAGVVAALSIKGGVPTPIAFILGILSGAVCGAFFVD